MNALQIVKSLAGRKGQHVRIGWTRQLKTRVNVESIVTKVTLAWVRSGIDFANIGKVKEGVENGERGEVQPLPWGHWKLFPFIIGHTPKGQTAEYVEVEYLRLYPASFENLKGEVQYFVNGTLLDVDTARTLCRASEFSKPDYEKPLCYTIKAENVTEIFD